MQVFRKIANTFLALLLVISTSGVTINKHYCLGFLKDISIFHEASSCMAEMNMQEEDCPMECCEETSEQLLVDDFKQVVFETNLTPQLKLLVMISNIIGDLQFDASNPLKTPYLNYSPPLIGQDIPVLVQSFLL